MMENLETKYNQLLKKSISGYYFRSFFLSDRRVFQYLEKQKNLAFSVEDLAYTKKEKIHSRRNLELNRKLTDLIIRFEVKRTGLLNIF